MPSSPAAVSHKDASRPLQQQAIDPDVASEKSSSTSSLTALHDKAMRPSLVRSDDCDNDSDSIPPQPRVRPHLSYLRSEWTSQDFSSSSSSSSSSGGIDEQEDLLAQRIVLPASAPSTDIEREVHRFEIVASGLCLAAVIVAGSSVESDSRYYYRWILALLGLYWLGLGGAMACFTRRHDIDLRQLAQHSALLTTAAFIPHNMRGAASIASLLMASFGFCLFLVARRIGWADTQQQRHFANERARAQQAVDAAVRDLAGGRVSFLSTVSQEVQDAALMVITTLEQFSPSSILTNTHELLSACSIAVPIASISAIHTTIKQVCYISSHLQLLGRLLRAGSSSSSSSSTPHTTPTSSEGAAVRSNVRVEFDIGDLVQNVGDAMAGMAAKLDVNLVLYHFDNGMHYTNVIGDEGALRHGLLDLLRNILEGCTPGAIIELGLNLEASETAGRLTITFEITHTASPAIPDSLTAAVLPDANLTVRILEYLGGTLNVTTGLGKGRTRYDMAVEMEAGGDNHRRRLLFLEEQALTLYPSVKFSSEPTLQELGRFIDSLRGLKMVLHAPKRSVFARHLTSCLASWNIDISHVPVVSLAAAGAASAASDGTTPTSEDAETSSPRPSGQPQVPSPAIAEEQLHSIPPTFVLIDDDVETLERKLREFRTQPPVSANALQHHHQQVRRHKPSKSVSSSNPAPNFFHQGTVAIIHFTSLTNYKRVRDTIRCFSAAPTLPPFSMPRLVVVPKPAGPRRFLTALHTAWNNSVVEPHFMPIATSPLSPTPHSIASVLQQHRPTGSESPGVPGTPATAAVATPHSDRGSHRSSPGGERRSRPTSGVYSPPPADGSSADPGNYFPMMGATSAPATATSAPPPPPSSSSSPGASAASLHHRAVAAAAASAGRRRSQTDHALQPSGELKHQSTDTASPSPPSPAASTAQPPLTPSVSTSATTPSDAVAQPEQRDLGASADNNAPDQQQQTPAAATTTPGDSAPPATAAAAAAGPRKVGGPRRSLKLNKRRKADKGSAFANVVSPPINVLLVEDNMINIAILSTWMKKHKIGCTVANDGQEAVERWKQGGFHLVLMDLQLPVMSGIEATKKIRAIERQQKIGVLPMNPSSSTTTDNGGERTSGASSPLLSSSPATAAAAGSQELPPSTFRSPVIIVALTASELESDRHAALAAGCNDFLTKPISLEWLEKKIIEWGCMQALIDFEGWRQWKRSTIDKPALGKEQKSAATVPASRTTAAAAQQQQQPQQAQPPSSKDQEDSSSSGIRRKGIMLAGAVGLGKRRFSTMDDRHARRAASSGGSRGRGLGFMPGPRSGSDSDLLAGSTALRPQCSRPSTRH